MKRLIISLVFTLVCFSVKAQFVQYTPVYRGSSRATPIVPKQSTYPFVTYKPTETVVSGTTYNAIVLYKSSTGFENTYKLPVVVNRGSVNKICFSNGGSVHIGVNNSGYQYYGGDLEYDEESEAYYTVVTIVYSQNSWARYTVIIPE